MSINIVTGCCGDGAVGLPKYWASLVKSLAGMGLDARRLTLGEWGDGTGGADPQRDIVVVLAHEIDLIPPEYAVIALRYGCATERGLRCSNTRSLRLGATEVAASARKRTFCVAASDWAAHYGYRHGGARTDRIIHGAVDVDTFMPGERQRLRATKRPTILHGCTEHDKGAGVIGSVCHELADQFDEIEMEAGADVLPETMRGGDIWLGLAASACLPAAVMEAMATDMVVVGTDVGLLWSLCGGRRASCGADRANLWLNTDAGVAVFDWQWRESPKQVAAFVRKAWAERKRLRPRDYARQWFDYPLFAAKWLDAIQAAAKRFGIKA